MQYLKVSVFHCNMLVLILVCCCVITSCKKTTSITSVNDQPVTEKSSAPEPVGPGRDAEDAPGDLVLAGDPNWPRPRSSQRLAERQRMVDLIRYQYELDDKEILDALLHVPRHWFVRDREQRLAYDDTPLPIGYDQTISQPYIVAYMSSLLELDKDKKVLEIGTGSGYQAAVLSELTPQVFSIEIVEPLGRGAKERLQQYGYTTVNVKIGDGYQGWPQEQPFDAIIVTCAPDHIPPALIEQLKPTGRMVIPVGPGGSVQELVLLTKNQQGKIARKTLIPVRFVPLVQEKND
ncbi:MAG: protein-L-isoaspartate(D-aspartate) O-methyltransferase [Sedimentisphaerales bacterium]|nr:protein-L-isoaspartate(D-aspartate) O-methyltransferase [Sedimentisphaerales bacterium]